MYGTCPDTTCNYDNAKGDQCDSCGKVYNSIELRNPKCSICHSIPKIEESNHVFINLPNIQNQVEEFVNNKVSNNKWSQNCVTLTNGLLKQGLKSRCITRDLKWGTSIPLEEFKDKVF